MNQKRPDGGEEQPIKQEGPGENNRGQDNKRGRDEEQEDRQAEWTRRNAVEKRQWRKHRVKEEERLISYRKALEQNHAKNKNERRDQNKTRETHQKAAAGMNSTRKTRGRNHNEEAMEPLTRPQDRGLEHTRGKYVWKSGMKRKRETSRQTTRREANQGTREERNAERNDIRESYVMHKVDKADRTALAMVLQAMVWAGERRWRGTTDTQLGWRGGGVGDIMPASLEAVLAKRMGNLMIDVNVDAVMVPRNGSGYVDTLEETLMHYIAIQGCMSRMGIGEHWGQDEIAKAVGEAMCASQKKMWEFLTEIRVWRTGYGKWARRQLTYMIEPKKMKQMLNLTATLNAAEEAENILRRRANHYRTTQRNASGGRMICLLIQQEFIAGCFYEPLDDVLMLSRVIGGVVLECITIKKALRRHNLSSNITMGGTTIPEAIINDRPEDPATFLHEGEVLVEYILKRHRGEVEALLDNNKKRGPELRIFFRKLAAHLGKWKVLPIAHAGPMAMWLGKCQEGGSGRWVYPMERTRTEQKHWIIPYGRQYGTTGDHGNKRQQGEDHGDAIQRDHVRRRRTADYRAQINFDGILPVTWRRNSETIIANTRGETSCAIRMRRQIPGKYAQTKEMNHYLIAIVTGVDKRGQEILTAVTKAIHDSNEQWHMNVEPLILEGFTTDGKEVVMAVPNKRGLNKLFTRIQEWRRAACTKMVFLETVPVSNIRRIQANMANTNGMTLAEFVRTHDRRKEPGTERTVDGRREQESGDMTRGPVPVYSIPSPEKQAPPKRDPTRAGSTKAMNRREKRAYNNAKGRAKKKAIEPTFEQAQGILQLENDPYAQTTQCGEGRGTSSTTAASREIHNCKQMTGNRTSLQETRLKLWKAMTTAMGTARMHTDGRREAEWGVPKSENKNEARGKMRRIETREREAAEMSRAEMREKRREKDQASGKVDEIKRTEKEEDRRREEEWTRRTMEGWQRVAVAHGAKAAMIQRVKIEGLEAMIRMVPERRGQIIMTQPRVTQTETRGNGGTLLRFRSSLEGYQLQILEAARIATQAAREAVEMANRCTKTRLDRNREEACNTFSILAIGFKGTTWGQLITVTTNGHIWSSIQEYSEWQNPTGAWIGWLGERRQEEDEAYRRYEHICREVGAVEPRARLQYGRQNKEPPFVVRKAIPRPYRNIATEEPTIEMRRRPTKIGQCLELIVSTREVCVAWHHYTNVRWRNILATARTAQEIGQLRMVTHPKGHILYSPEGHIITRVCMCGWGVAGADTAEAMMLHRTGCRSRRRITTTRTHVADRGIAAICWDAVATHLQRRPIMRDLEELGRKASRTPLGRMAKWWHDTLNRTTDTMCFTSPCPSHTRPQVEYAPTSTFHSPQLQDQPWDLPVLGDEPTMDDIPPCPTDPATMGERYRTIIAATYLVGGGGKEATLWVAAEEMPGKVDARQASRSLEWLHMHEPSGKDKTPLVHAPEGYAAVMGRGTSPTAATSWTARQMTAGSSIATYLVHREINEMIETGSMDRYEMQMDINKWSLEKSRSMVRYSVPLQVGLVRGREKEHGLDIGVRDTRWDGFIQLQGNGGWDGIQWNNDHLYIPMPMRYDEVETHRNQKHYRETPMRVKAREAGHDKRRDETYHGQGTEWRWEQKMGEAWMDIGRESMREANARAWRTGEKWEATLAVDKDLSEEEDLRWAQQEGKMAHRSLYYTNEEQLLGTQHIRETDKMLG